MTDTTMTETLCSLIGRDSFKMLCRKIDEYEQQTGASIRLEITERRLLTMHVQYSPDSPTTDHIYSQTPRELLEWFVSPGAAQ